MDNSEEDNSEEARRRIEECEQRQSEELDLSELGLSEVPHAVWALHFLVTLELQKNRLSALSASIGQCKALQKLNVASNQISALPASIGQCKALQRLDAYNNQITTLPASIGQCEALQKLYVANNQISALPASIGQCEALRYLDAYNNQITTLPASIGQCEALLWLYVANNQITALPASIGQCKALQYLGVAKNQITTLPASIGQCKALQQLIVHNNPLVDPPIEVCKKGVKAIAAYFEMALPSLAELDLAMATNEPIKLSAQHMHLITDNFSGALLGKGGQGCVTIGNWGDQPVAVKSMKTDDLFDDRGFAAELAALMQCGDHPNIMKLYGYYDKSSLQDEEDLGANFFVMPLMKGDLLKVMTTMGWEKRLQALLDALEGLHELHKRNFLHWDIKPANILIHDNGTACLADCSLSKQMDDGVMNAQTCANYSTMLGVVGTPGYTDPAYMQSGVYHRYSDVYSMAIVMLQLLTSKPTPQLCDEQGLPLMNLLSFCDMKYDEGKFMEAADNEIWSEVPEVVEVLLDLAMRCSDGSRERIAKKRPTVEQCIAEITKMLQSDDLSQPIDEPSAEAMQLSAQTLTGHTIKLHVSTSTTIAQVKTLIELQDSGIPAEGMLLLCIPKQGKNMLPDSDSLESLQISDGDMLKIIVGRR